MADAKCKICRRAGEKLFLKGDKCFTPKCTFEKKPAPPGKPLNERKHRSNVTEFGTQLREKQKVKNVYGVSEKQFANYVEKAMNQKGGSPVDRLYEHLEHRLDNVVYRLGLSTSRAHSRQMVSHGHILINNIRTTIPSHRVSEGDKVTVREGSKSLPLFTALTEVKRAPPNWLSYQHDKLTAEITGVAKYDRTETGFNFQQVIEFYSR